jgi:hypothetical protein
MANLFFEELAQADFSSFTDFGGVLAFGIFMRKVYLCLNDLVLTF